MSQDETPPVDVPAAPARSVGTDEEVPPRRIEEDSGDIPYLGAEMLHRERVDLEKGMSAVPPVTIALILACAAVYLRQVWVGGPANRMRVVAMGAMSRDEVLKGELWRLISGGFLHANAEHLIGNLAMLLILGMACEHAFGRGPFLFLYVSTGVTGSLMAMISATPTVGASGAIFGLAGALVSSILAHRDRIEIRDHRVAIVLAAWAAYTLALGLLSPMVSNGSHVGGLLGGLLLGGLLPSALLRDRRDLDALPLSRLQAAIAIAVMLGTAIFFLPHLAA